MTTVTLEPDVDLLASGISVYFDSNPLTATPMDTHERGNTIQHVDGAGRMQDNQLRRPREAADISNEAD